MANESSGGPTDEAVEGSWSPRRSKATAAKPKAGSSPDPEVLADEIEKTREELAETLDAIAEKVSPKRVVTRTKKKVGDAVKDGASEAADGVKDTAAAAAQGVKSGAAAATDAVKGGVAQVKEKVSGENPAAPADRPLPPAAAVEPAASPLSEDTVSLPGAEVPLEPAPTPGALADAAQVSAEPAGAEAYTPSPYLPPAPSRLPALAGAGAALLVLLLVLRRRRR